MNRRRRPRLTRLQRDLLQLLASARGAVVLLDRSDNLWIPGARRAFPGRMAGPILSRGLAYFHGNEREPGLPHVVRSRMLLTDAGRQLARRA